MKTMFAHELLRKSGLMTPHIDTENCQRARLVSLVQSIRKNRAFLKSGDESGLKYVIAGEIRKEVRQARDDGIISFECCNALQRALDY